MQDVKKKDDIFGTQKKLKLGPGQYDTSLNLIKHQTPVTHFKPILPPEKTFEEKQKQETKMIRLFDGSASTIKN
jgi:hypothetical protein